MDGKTAAITAVASILIIAAIALLLPGSDQQRTHTNDSGPSGPEIRVAAWNIQRFGPDKAGNSTLMGEYADRIRQYDIVFLQEITDATNESFPLLCSLLTDYRCINGSKAGRTSYREQYGMVYRKNLSLLAYRDLNPDILDRWERPPLEATFGLGGYNMTFVLLHAKPSDVGKEMRDLETLLMTADGDLAVIGDLNADCDYYKPASVNSTEFDSWFWAIPDSEDTTVSRNTHCAYDRIILNDGAKQRFKEYGVDRNVTGGMSDHYLVWMRIG
ncbi:Endonuclease/Exonuclease/phosphatase family protein [uncultured archaeon]|nr:Endonuclease/Exonuclease/phosphatase family protein [uncultured archaeon]